MRDSHDYTIEVCIVCGCQLSRGTAAGRCVDRSHWGSGGMVVRVLARPLTDQTERATQHHWRAVPAAAVASREQQAPAEAVIRCKVCAGSGAQLCECDRGERPITTCFACSGRECSACGGSGQTREPVSGFHPTPEEDR